MFNGERRIRINALVKALDFPFLGGKGHRDVAEFACNHSGRIPRKEPPGSESRAGADDGANRRRKGRTFLIKDIKRVFNPGKIKPPSLRLKVIDKKNASVFKKILNDSCVNAKGRVRHLHTPVFNGSGGGNDNGTDIIDSVPGSDNFTQSRFKGRFLA